MQILDWQHQVVGECSVAVDDAKCSTLRAMSRHATLAIRAVKTMAGRIYFANDTLANQVGERSCSGAFMHGFGDAYKFVSWHALESHIAACDFQVGVTNTCQQDTYQGFTFHKSRVRIMRFKR